MNDQTFSLTWPQDYVPGTWWEDRESDEWADTKLLPRCKRNRLCIRVNDHNGVCI